MGVIQLDDFREPSPKRAKVKPFNQTYPMPFFESRKGGGINAWNVEPSGNYSEDIATGEAYAMQFLKSFDGSYGWHALLPAIVSDMIGAGAKGKYANGQPKTDGVVLGFMSVIAAVVCSDLERRDMPNRA